MFPHVIELRGIPLWLVREYLQELGGKIRDDATLTGTGWTVHLVQLEDFQVGSIRVGQIRLEVEASPHAWDSLRPSLEKKLLRGGG